MPYDDNSVVEPWDAAMSSFGEDEALQSFSSGLYGRIMSEGVHQTSETEAKSLREWAKYRPTYSQFAERAPLGTSATDDNRLALIRELQDMENIVGAPGAESATKRALGFLPETPGGMTPEQTAAWEGAVATHRAELAQESPDARDERYGLTGSFDLGPAKAAARFAGEMALGMNPATSIPLDSYYMKEALESGGIGDVALAGAGFIPVAGDIAKLAKAGKAGKAASSAKAIKTEAPTSMTQLQIDEATAAWWDLGTESPFFRKWFGKSSVSDAKGTPIVVHHGTRADIDTFKPSREGRYGPGVYLTARGADDAAGWARRKGGEGVAVPLYARLESPFFTETVIDGRLVEEWASLARSGKAMDQATANSFLGAMRRYEGMPVGNFMTWIKSGTSMSSKMSDGIGDILRRSGHDGVVDGTKRQWVKDPTAVREFTVFDPGQLKRADTPSGHFSADLSIHK